MELWEETKLLKTGESALGTRVLGYTVEEMDGLPQTSSGKVVGFWRKHGEDQRVR